MVQVERNKINTPIKFKDDIQSDKKISLRFSFYHFLQPHDFHYMMAFLSLSQLINKCLGAKL